jgi:hypothetical protein
LCSRALIFVTAIFIASRATSDGESYSCSASGSRKVGALSKKKIKGMRKELLSSHSTTDVCSEAREPNYAIELSLFLISLPFLSELL